MDLTVGAGKTLTQKLRGKVNAVGILFNEALAKSFYEGPNLAPSYQKAAAHIDLLAHKDPSLNILGVGAGTGGCTSPILDKLSNDTTDYVAIFATSGLSLAAPSVAITQGLKRKLAKLLGMPDADIDVQQPLQAYGVDSLVAVEIRYWLSKVVRAGVSISDIQGEMSMVKLGEVVVERSALSRGVGGGERVRDSGARGSSRCVRRRH